METRNCERVAASATTLTRDEEVNILARVYEETSSCRRNEEKCRRREVGGAKKCDLRKSEVEREEGSGWKE